MTSSFIPLARKTGEGKIEASEFLAIAWIVRKIL
jgi:hypothetical protein